jgi:hypothetical protein
LFIYASKKMTFKLLEFSLGIIFVRSKADLILCQCKSPTY